MNCGTTFADNYCPRCGQKASIGRLTWANVKESVMNVWGVGNRSMPYSLLQLLGRPAISSETISVASVRRAIHPSGCCLSWPSSI